MADKDGIGVTSCSGSSSSLSGALQSFRVDISSMMSSSVIDSVVVISLSAETKSTKLSPARRANGMSSSSSSSCTSVVELSMVEPACLKQLLMVVVVTEYQACCRNRSAS